jgi:hypothetical protein
MGGDFVRLDQRHIGDEQAQDALAFAHIDPRVVPDPRKLLGKIKDATARLGVKDGRFLGGASLVILNDVGMKPKLFIPFSLERIGDKAIVRIDLHVTAPSQLGVIAHSLYMFASQSVGFGGAGFELALNREAHLQSHRSHKLEQERADGGIDHLARHRLADLAALPDRGLLAHISRDAPAVFLAVLDRHAPAAQTAKNASLEQAGSLARRTARAAADRISLSIVGELFLVLLEALPVDVAWVHIRHDDLPLSHTHLDLGHAAARPGASMCASIDKGAGIS